ncbi:hypothetical protein GCM10009425_40360 [Pseudomonas asuensis]|uniref:Uncharacterized protein n=1 Tax=Pseudomonas asuensis TaxID=1825787 RepID=A0ABQ2H2X3_9PSED|nr:hypothetical protein [Pseudomonas asuensis]GGM25519.1 hypothetical protein GCM10009425_40360 [Pseudomonas asuensis]
MRFANLEAVPAYFAKNSNGDSVPFIVTVMFQDQHGHHRITPAIENSINRTIEITGREGLAIASIALGENIESKVPECIDRAMHIDGAIVLFRCQTGELCEKVMQLINVSYQISMVRED